LYWHCHFIQKLESEPEIEWRNMHRGYDMLRENEFNHTHFEALKSAQTGWPMVDACVTMLHETGWLNFRMRAIEGKKAVIDQHASRQVFRKLKRSPAAKASTEKQMGFDF
jgi:deoxyribodipyrimidine photolyase